MDGLEFIRNGGETRRFHTFPVIRQQNVAEHSWHQAMLLWYMYGGTEPGIRMQLLMAVLCSDAAEHKVGDIPSPAKRSMDQRLELKGSKTFRQVWNEMEEEILTEHQWNWRNLLTTDELRMMQLTDSMDGALYCVRERAMGNQLIVECYMNYISYIKELLNDRTDVDVPFEGEEPPRTFTENEWEVYDYIVSQWELVNGSF